MSEKCSTFALSNNNKDMKRTIITLALSLVSATSMACAPSTGHGVLTLGATYDYSLRDKVHSTKQLGMGGVLGYETKNRYVVISGVWGVSNLDRRYVVTDSYCRNDIHWRLGGSFSVCPIREFGYLSPIIFDIQAGAGYDNYEKEYIGVGLQLRGGMDNFFVPFAKVNFEYMGFAHSEKSWNINMSIGIRFWLGKAW